ncbi:hypothetical protein [Actinomadura fibrosa]|uniref:Uncharacterized protein n=1 Tax=Actinomadura fibrosa TaxID=111802 RepID=A0ABW2XW33_9ACTN|nr:hypothetical protein [Actinomadura fibrosa]
MRRTINPGRVVRTGTGRYTVMLLGLGAAGVAIGWLGPGPLGAGPLGAGAAAARQASAASR